ncbi:hypothetical protein BVY00_02580 [bacterium G20]|nr:hypothetical protein BVY00_02580 [bacterium G20]
MFYKPKAYTKSLSRFSTLRLEARMFILYHNDMLMSILFTMFYFKHKPYVKRIKKPSPKRGGLK